MYTITYTKQSILTGKAKSITISHLDKQDAMNWTKWLKMKNRYYIIKFKGKRSDLS